MKKITVQPPPEPKPWAIKATGEKQTLEDIFIEVAKKHKVNPTPNLVSAALRFAILMTDNEHIQALETYDRLVGPQYLFRSGSTGLNDPMLAMGLKLKNYTMANDVSKDKGLTLEAYNEELERTLHMIVHELGPAKAGKTLTEKILSYPVMEAFNNEKNEFINQFDRTNARSR